MAVQKNLENAKNCKQQSSSLHDTIDPSPIRVLTLAALPEPAENPTYPPTPPTELREPVCTWRSHDQGQRSIPSANISLGRYLALARGLHFGAPYLFWGFYEIFTPPPPPQPGCIRTNYKARSHMQLVRLRVQNAPPARMLSREAAHWKESYHIFGLCPRVPVGSSDKVKWPSGLWPTLTQGYPQAPTFPATKQSQLLPIIVIDLYYANSVNRTQVDKLDLNYANIFR